MSETRWTADDMPDQHGRTAVITGANTGLGFALAELLVARGANVVLACRSPAKAAAAATRLRPAATGGAVTTVRFDQSSQESIREAAKEIAADNDRVDLLINNAGLLGTTQRSETVDGLEATLATNHLGVFLLTGLLLDQMLAVPGSRVVTMSSISNARQILDLNDLQSTHGYNRNTVYSRSKLANLMFAYDLQTRLVESGAQTISLAAHPGQSRTEFTRDLSPLGRLLYSPKMRLITGLVMQDKAVGVLAPARAATDPHSNGGEYYGPSGFMQLTGHPVTVDSNDFSHDRAAQKRLWEESEKLTDFAYPS